MRLREDPNVNRMEESLSLFKNVINNQYFSNVPIVLFLNKTDLFKEKVQRIPIKNTFQDFQGTCVYLLNEPRSYF